MFEIFDIHMPLIEKNFLKELYSSTNNKCILEFGSGGSTLLGLLNGKVIISIETDRDYQRKIMEIVLFNQLKGHLIPILADLGKTKKWGYPIERSKYKNYSKQLNNVFKLIKELNLKIDLVLIDGRFRVTTLLKCLIELEPPFQIIFDDYISRKHYHIVDNFLKPELHKGRMGVFKVDRNIRNKAIKKSLENYTFDPR